MDRRPLVLSLALLVALGLAPMPAVSAQSPWVRPWLREYAQGGQAAVGERLRTIGSLKQLQDDLEVIMPDWLGQTGSAPGGPRHSLVGFAIEAASARLDQPAAATKLIEWACRQVRRDTTPDEFDRRWHWVALALFEGAVDPDGLEAHLTHMKFQFPSEPRVALVRGVAEELRVFTSSTGAKASHAEAVRHGEEAARRFQEAAKEPTTAVEANVRLAHVLIGLGRFEPALAALDRAGVDRKPGAPADAKRPAPDPDIVYLATLFRALALDHLGRVDDARRAYDAALELQPGRQTAVLSLSAMLFRHGQRDEAAALTDRLLIGGSALDDPWWEYWPGDYRSAPALIRAMREVMK